MVRYINPQTGQISIGQNPNLGTTQKYNSGDKTQTNTQGQNTKQGQKERCIARGGTWDGSVCHYPEADVTIKSQDPIAYKNTLERARMEATGGYAARSAEELRAQNLLPPTAEQQQNIADIEQNKPEITDISPEYRPGQEVPVLGAGGVTIGNVLLDKIVNPIWKKISGENPNLVLEPENVRSAAIRQIEQDAIDEGVTWSESFGAVVEGIPLVGSLVSKYASGLIETPSGNVNTITQEIGQARTKAMKWESWANQGIISQNVLEENLNQMDTDIIKLEARIKVLANFSPELRYNSDGINLIEEKILNAKEVIWAIRLRQAKNVPQSPSDYDLLNALEGE